MAPVAGEALDSWIEQGAHRLDAHLGDYLGVLAAADYRGRGDHRHREPAHWTVQLPDHAAARLAALTGLAPAQLHAMTLARYDGTVLRIDPQNHVVVRQYLWGRASGSRFCPDCLRDSGGRWQLWWRLGWAFACLQHHQLLADTCPACHQPQRQRFAPVHVIPRPGHCMRPLTERQGIAEQRCGGDLTRAGVLSLPVNHPALTTQRLLLEIINSGRTARGIYADDPQPAHRVLADARALANRVLSYATTEELSGVVPADLLSAYNAPAAQLTAFHTRAARRPGFLAPTHAIRAAVGLTVAFSALDATDVQTGGTVLRWLIKGMRERQVAVSATSTASWGQGTSPALAAVQLAALGPLLAVSDRLRYRTATSRPRRPHADTTAISRRARAVPTLFWPDWALRLWPSGAGYFSSGRLALSSALLVVDTKLTLGQIVQKLGAPLSGAGVGRLLQIMGAEPSWPEVSMALTRLVDYVDIHDIPIDYERRGQLDYDALLPDDIWVSSCRRLGRPSRGRSTAIARAVLFERLSGLPADQAPGFVDSMDFRARVATFPRHLDSELAVVLDQAAQDYLRDQGIEDEPVTWQPPLDLLADLQLPGPDPARVDPVALHRIVRQSDTTLEAAAAELGTTIDVVRHLLVQNPLPHRPAKRQVLIRVRPALSRAEFVRLYEDQRLSLKEIADQLRIGRNTLTRLAREYGITLRRPGLTAKTSIDPEWLYEQYVVLHRTLPELAREVGVSTMTMNHWAHDHDIPLRPRGCGSRRENLDKSGPPKTIPPRAWLYDQYVNRGRTLNELADQAGVSEAVMRRWVHLHEIPVRRAGGSSHRANLPQRLSAAANGPGPHRSP